jgi:hypothetical protein
MTHNEIIIQLETMIEESDSYIVPCTDDVKLMLGCLIADLNES